MNSVMNNQNANKILHGIILVFFAVACGATWSVLSLSNLLVKLGQPLPPFSRVWIAVGPFVLAGLVSTAVVYCLVVWLRGAGRQPSWVAFLAATMSLVALSVVPTAIAVYLPTNSLILQLSV